MRQAMALIDVDTVLADAGYDAEHNHRLCREELGLRRSVIALNPRNVGDRQPKTSCRRALHHDFPGSLHRQRWHVESAFSQHKRRFGLALAARRVVVQQHELIVQQHELIWRVRTHNVALLAEAG